jgi:RND superfamily putative drug exporter
MDRLTAILERRRWLILGAWLVVVLAAAPFAAKQTEHLTSGGFTVPGSGSDAVDRALAGFEGAQRESLAVVLARRPGATVADVRAAVDRADRAAAKLPHVELTDRAEAAAKREAARSPIAIATLSVTGDRDQTADTATDLREEIGAGDGPRDGVETYLVGQQALWAGMQELSKEDLASAEVTGFPIVLLILLAVFGSLAAAALPLALGFVSVLITGAVIYFLSQAMDMSVFTTNVASMIGIGVAVDYSLFVLARYREEIRAGAEPADACRAAMRTSGVAVAFSGLTVMVSLAGLFLVDSTTIRSMALGAIVVVAVSILAALTFLPVLMRVLGQRAYTRGRPAVVVSLLSRNLRRRRPGSVSPGKATGAFWQRWTERVTRRPVLAAALSAGALVVLAIPAPSLEFGDGALRQFPQGDDTRIGAELAAEKVGAGATGPTQLVAAFHAGTARTPENRAALADYARTLRRDPEVTAVARPVPSPDGRAALVAVIPSHDPESAPARALVDRMRAAAGRREGLAEVAQVDVGGATASVEDFRDLVAGSMWKIALFVLAFSYLVLFLLLRSVLLPLKAVLMNLLSVGAAYGVLVAVFQYGWLDGITGYESLGYINTMTPPFLLAIVFGLSMDYEVFLLSRIRERYDATGDTKLAVAQGLARSAATISSAALIMVAVFAVFAGTGVPSIKEIGLGLAVAIALDATLVRLVLVPATMEIMGRWNWWLPSPLARVLPEAGFEASGAADRLTSRA